jgi:hypothetical protein
MGKMAKHANQILLNRLMDNFSILKLSLTHKCPNSANSRFRSMSANICMKSKQVI